MYASFRGISEALHLYIFKQPLIIPCSRYIYVLYLTPYSLLFPILQGESFVIWIFYDLTFRGFIFSWFRAPRGMFTPLNAKPIHMGPLFFTPPG